jgi:hypothetical protein
MRMCLQHEPERRPQTGTDVLRLLLRAGEELPAELLQQARLVGRPPDQIVQTLDAAMKLNGQRGATPAAASAAPGPNANPQPQGQITSESEMWTGGE